MRLFHDLPPRGLPVAALALWVREPARDVVGEEEVGPSLKEAARHFARHWSIYVPLTVFSTTHGMLSLTFAA